MNFKNRETGEEIAREQVKDLWNKGEIKTLPLNFGDINLFNQQICFYMTLKNGCAWLLATSKATVKRSLEMFMNPKTSEVQRTRVLYDIARWDMIPQAMIGFFGNEKLPKELEGWKPTFGYGWQFEAMQEVPRSDMQGNLYWHEQSKELYEKHQAQVKVPRVKDIEMAIVENESLMISYGGTSNIYKFSEMPKFWDKKSNVPNNVAHMMIDLSLDVDGCLKQKNPYHKTFGKGKTDQSSKHISKLANALDSIIQTDDQIGKATDRWFKVSKHRDKVWKPIFTLKSSRTTEEKEIIRNAMKQNHTVSKIAENMDNLDYGNKWKKVEDREEMSFEVKSEKQMGLEDWKAEKEMNFSD